MKTTKKILALVMAVAFVFSLCVFSASAYDLDGNVNVEIRLYGEYAWDWSMDQATIASYIGNDVAPVAPYTADAYHVYYVPTTAGTQTTSLTAADALLAAYLEVFGSYDGTQVHYTWYPNEDEVTHLTSWGVYFDNYDGLEPVPPTYYLVDSWQEGDTWYYEYYWKGDAWNLYINGLETSKYASEYELGTSYSEFNNTQPQYIVLDYNEVRSDNFVTTTYIPGAIPDPA